MNIAKRFDLAHSREMQWALIALCLDSMQQISRNYPNCKCLWAAVRHRHFSLKWRKSSSQTETRWDRTQFTKRSPKKLQRPRAIVRLRVHRGLGLEKQLDHLRAAASRRRIVQRGPASVRSPSCERSTAAWMCHHIKG